MNINTIISSASSDKTIRANWCLSNNIGDALNVWLPEKISGKKSIFAGDYSIPHFICVGSILNWANENSCVWGAGLATYADCVNPKVNILAVRGPLSRKRALENKCSCPDIYGDPALLMPKFYTPKSIQNEYRLGIIPHYLDQETVYNMNFPSHVKIINVFSDVESFADDVWSCEYIVSSSLHGLVIANAYGKNALYVKIADKIIGDGMKYADYFASVRTKNYAAVPFKIITDNVDGIVDLIKSKTFNIDTTKLLSVCPF